MNSSERYQELAGFKIPLIWGVVGIGCLFSSELLIEHLAVPFNMRVAITIVQLLPMALCLYTFAMAVLRQDELKRRIMSEGIVLGTSGTIFVMFVYAALERMKIWAPTWNSIGAWLPILCWIGYQITKRRYA